MGPPAAPAACVSLADTDAREWKLREESWLTCSGRDGMNMQQHGRYGDGQSPCPSALD